MPVINLPLRYLKANLALLDAAAYTTNRDKVQRKPTRPLRCGAAARSVYGLQATELFAFLCPRPFVTNLNQHHLIFQYICKQIAASDFMVSANRVHLGLSSSTFWERGDQT